MFLRSNVTFGSSAVRSANMHADTSRPSRKRYPCWERKPIGGIRAPIHPPKKFSLHHHRSSLRAKAGDISNLNFNYCCIIRRNLTTTYTFMFSHFSVIIIPITFKSCKWVQSAVHTSGNGTAMAWREGERRSTNFIKIYSISSYDVCMRAGPGRFSDFKLIRRTSRKSLSYLRLQSNIPICLCK